MKRAANSGMVWQPVEYVLLGVVVLLIGFLVWTIREIDRLEVADTSKPSSSQEGDGDISQLVEQGIIAEEAIDATYDNWEAQSTGPLDSAADDIGGVYDETAF